LADDPTKDGNWFASTMIMMEETAEMETEVPAGGVSEFDSAEHVTLEQPGRYTLLNKDALYQRERHRKAEDEEEAELARGGMGRLLLTFDNHLGRDVAVKELLPGFEHSAPPPATAGYGAGGPSGAHTSELETRFLREARVTGQLEHPAIVPVYELGCREDGTLYYTMKLVRGRTLHQAIYSSTSLEERLRLLAHVRDLAHAISYAHSRGVINRDIKPQNIMVGEFGETVVLDWGLAKVLGRDDFRGREIVRSIEMGEGDSGANTVALFLGTPNYMPPEQAWGQLDEVDERSDVWSIGCVLYELLGKKPPYSEGNALMTVCAVREDAAPSLEEVAPEAPKELATIAMRCLERDKEKRYQTAREVALEIERYQAGGRVSAHEYGSWELLKRFVIRNKALSAAVAVAVVTLVVSTVLVWGQYRSALESEHRARQSESAARVSEGKALHSAQAARTARGVAEEARDEARAREKEAREAQELADKRREEANAERLRAIEAEEETRGHLAEAFVQKSRYASEQWLYDRAAGYAAEALRLRERPDARGRLMAYLSDEGAARMVGALPPVPAGITTLAVSDNEKWMAAGTKAGTIIIWCIEKGLEQARVAAHSGSIVALDFVEGVDELVSRGADGIVSRWTKDGLLKVSGAYGAGPHGTIKAGGPQATDASGGQRTEPPPVSGTSRSGSLTVVLGSRGGLTAHRPDDNSQLFRVAGHAGAVQSLAYSPDGRFMATAGAGGGLAVWQLDSGQQSQWIPAHDDKALSVQFSPDGAQLASGGKDGKVRIWDLTGKSTMTAQTGFGEVYNVAWSLDSQQLGVAGRGGRAGLFDARTGESLLTFVGHKGRVFSLDFCPNAPLIATAGEDGTVRIWDAMSGEEKVAHKAHDGPVYSVAFSPDGAALASAGADRTAAVWRVDPWEIQVRLEGHLRSVQGLGFSPDGLRLATGSYDKSVRLWDTATGALQAILNGHSKRVSSVTFSPDGSVLATGGGDSVVRFWQVGSPEHPAELSAHEGKVYSIDFSPNGNLLASAGEDGIARVWSARTGKRVRALFDHQGKLFTVRFSPDGRLIATAGADRTIRLRNVGKVDLAASLHGNEGYTWLIRFAPDGKQLASCGSEPMIRLWDIETGKQTGSLRAGAGKVWSLVYSPDGKSLAAGGADGKVTVWDVDSGRERAQLDAHGGVVLSLAFSPDGRLAAGDSMETVRVWSAGLDKTPLELRGDSGMVYSLDFSADGRTLASGGAMGVVHFWSMPTGAEQARIEREGESRSIHSLRFAPDGTRLAVAGEGGVVRFIDLTGLYISPEQLAETGLKAFRLVLDGISLAPDPAMTRSRFSGFLL
jgi:eukaryotic-like serine/threonine-protein kinase